jgi:hypothetical protein
MKLFKLLIFAVLTFLFFNCVSVIEKTGRIIDGSAFKEKTTAVYKAVESNDFQSDMKLSVVENKSNEKSIIITIDKFPMIKFLGSYPDEDGVFFMTALEYLAGSTHGWNEYSLELAGTGTLKFDDTVILNIEEIEPVQIVKGGIQKYDTRITGSEALPALRNRRERILALTEWMETINTEKGKSIGEFENYWKPVLFPEMTARKKRPDGWAQEGDKFLRAEGILWNTGFSERVFPEELWPIRNSGTLLRDWEEASSWIYLEYEWKNIVESLYKEITFIKIK